MRGSETTSSQIRPEMREALAQSRERRTKLHGYAGPRYCLDFPCLGRLRVARGNTHIHLFHIRALIRSAHSNLSKFGFFRCYPFGTVGDPISCLALEGPPSVAIQKTSKSSSLTPGSVPYATDHLPHKLFRKHLHPLPLRAEIISPPPELRRVHTPHLPRNQELIKDVAEDNRIMPLDPSVLDCDAFPHRHPPLPL
jgi:hypothetical protein